MFWSAAVEMFLRLWLGAIFATSGWSKLRYAAPAWVGLGIVELAVGLAVLTGAWLRLTVMAILALLAAFTVYLYFAWRAQAREDCGCGGILGDARLGRALLVRNGVLAGAALGLLLLVAGGGTAAGLDRLLQPTGGRGGLPAAEWAGTLTGLILAGIALALFLRFRKPDEKQPEGDE